MDSPAHGTTAFLSDFDMRHEPEQAGSRGHESPRPVSQIDSRNPVSHPSLKTPKDGLSRSRQQKSLYHSWQLEVAAALLSVSALLGIILLLPFYAGRPVSSWTFFLSINTVIAILGTTSRATLAFVASAALAQEKWNWFRSHDENIIAFDRFDEASKGPWGSARLLWWVKLR